jgi:LmbE family N-acetylglucosaminyl deacetylase
LNVRVLLVGAHPDDTEFICGGTIATLTSRGEEVRYVVVTSGERGLPPDAVDLSAREDEQRLAAHALMVTHVDFLREPDGEVAETASLRRKIVEVIRRFQPEIVITHSPVYNLSSVRYSHADHLAVGRATLAAVFPEARNLRYHLDAGSPWVVPEVWLCGVEKPNYALDITKHFDVKMSAVRLHHTQMRHFSDADAFFREWADEVAQRHGLGAGVLAEEFHRLSTK